MGKSGKTVGWIVVALLIVVGIRIGISLANKPDDPKLIREALAEAVKASKEGRPGGVVELFSKNLKVNEMDVGSNRGQISNFIRTQKPSVRVISPEPKITGDEARIVSPVELDLGLLGTREVKDVTMIFQRENSTEFLVFPSTKWRLIEVRAPESAVSDLISG